jgi:hypothetical protein
MKNNIIRIIIITLLVGFSVWYFGNWGYHPRAPVETITVGMPL